MDRRHLTTKRTKAAPEIHMSVAGSAVRTNAQPHSMPMLSAMVSLACAAMAAGVHAQDAVPAPALAASAAASVAAPAPPSAASGLDSVTTVTVTATRRREPAREVPVQVQAIAAAELEKAGASQLSDYLADQPGVNVNSGGASYNSVTVRGVSTGAQTVATVGIYVDDIAFGSSGAYSNGAQTALNLSLLDLNHIEVLRGPQGTLYGAGAMGGLLKYVTNEPDTYERSGKIGLGVDFTKDGGVGHTENALINVPLKEDVAGLRVAAFHEHTGGYIDAIGADPGRNTNRGDSSGGRVSLLIEPTAKFKLRLTALTEDIQRSAHDYVDYDGTTGRPAHGALEHDRTVPEPLSSKVQLGSIGLEYDLGWARFESISSAQTSSLDNKLDYTPLYAPLLQAAAGLTVDTVPLHTYSRTQKQTQEFRLTSPSDETFEWLGGIFYTHERGENHQFLTSTLPGGTQGPDLVTVDIPSRLTELAAYGDLTWKPVHGLALTGGIRIARNQQKFSEDLSGVLSGGDQALVGSSNETSKTYLGTISYALTSTSNVYARAASGYRPGGPNVVLNDPNTHLPLAPAQFKHDSLWSYEAGYKADLLDKKLSVEASVYDIRWKDIQQLVSVNGLGVITNGGKAQIDGTELALRYKATSQWDVNAALSYLDARLTQGATGLGNAGAPLPNTARLSASLGSNFNFSLGDHAAWIGGSERYIGDRHAGFTGSALQPDFRVPEYWLTDAQAGIDFGKRVQLSMYVRNLFDRRAMQSASTINLPLNGPVEVTLVQPRTVGLSLNASF